MADSIRLKGGVGNVPTLLDREPAYHKEEEALYIGTENGNVRLCGAKDVETLNAAIGSLRTLIEDITARLGKLEKPSE
jgi:hypothetical protein